MAKAKQARVSAKERVEKHEQAIPLTLTDGERTLNLGCATVKWSTPRR